MITGFFLPFKKVIIALGIVLIATLFVYRVVLALGGILDTTFGTDGIVVTRFNDNSGDDARAVAIQSDGKIIVAGTSQDQSVEPYIFSVGLARYNVNGSLDNSFGVDGKVTTNIGEGESLGQAVAIQTDGKIVVGGFHFNNGDADFMLLRYLTDGSLDTDFGTGGMVRTHFDGTYRDEIKAIAIQPDGKIVAAGYLIDYSYEIGLARYNSDGSLDPNFGTNGKVITRFEHMWDLAFSLDIQLDGKIVVAGEKYVVDSHDFLLVRYNNDGLLDTTFGASGMVTTDFSSSADIAEGIYRNDYSSAVLIQPDQKILAAGGGGYNDVPGRGYDFELARYNSDGSLDPSFGTAGKVITEFDTLNSEGYAAALQPDGKIVVVGYATNNNFALARYNSDGSLDATFGINGKMTTHVGTPGSTDVAKSVAIQQDGRIVVAGNTQIAYSKIGLARYVEVDYLSVYLPMVIR